MEWDAVVIGLGGVGSFALSALSKESSKVLGIERFERGHDHGSSHGASRIYRQAYFEHPNYVPWIQYSIQEFKRLEQIHKMKLLHECGTLILEEPDDGHVIDACLKSASQHGVEVERLSNSQLQERYPQFNCGNATVGLLEPGGGFVRPEQAIKAALADAESRGATIWEQTIVNSFCEIKSPNGETLNVEVVVERNNGTRQVVTCNSVVIAAGSWAAELIPSWGKKLKVTRQLQAWMDVSTAENPELYHPSNMPTWYMCTPKSKLPIYGIPADPENQQQQQSWIKVGVHLRNDVVDPNDAPATLNDAELRQVRDAGRIAIRNCNDLTLVSTKPCLYTMSPDEHFIIGTPKGSKRTYAVAGLSGHGFKMTPALGQMMADWALQHDTSHWKTEFVSPSRFDL
jgi:sarcosine oxidase